MRSPALVVLNPLARRGRGRRLFERVRPEIDARFDATLVETDAEGRWTAAVKDALRAGVRMFVAAGGDGTVHALANALVARRGDVALSAITVGAVGLGSSNDFHKPVARRVRGIPVRLDADRALPRDLIHARFADGEGAAGGRVVVVSASLGLTARANRFFNEGRGPVRWLKGIWTHAAIVYAAVRTLVRHRDVGAVLRTGEETWSGPLANLSQLKTPHLSGVLRYDTPVEPASGRFTVNLLEAVGFRGLVCALADLARGRFRGRPGTRTWSTDRLDVDLESAQPLELDGEVVRARHVRFVVLPERIRACA